MRWRESSATRPRPRVQGFTLIEALVFIVVVSVALVAVMQIYGQALVNSVDPIVRVKAVELARATLDDIVSRRFDENSPTGGVPACGTGSAPACLGIAPEADQDDVGDYHGWTSSPDAGYALAVTVVAAGTDLGLAAEQARKITVTVTMPDGHTLALAAYKVNY